ncbi:MFS transporter [Agrococcus sp. SGAir0287]|uniref:MFS transporter n=1 Tax=Agrococcus sp. SGAir0287 TaxID=2070347 RepID=UPI0010CCCA5F|nr:MFS transporter [Agrococcus sp. SGAir0287]QCR20208.1 MFS transporter [Agrococcus sp. SGAir0287]
MSATTDPSTLPDDPARPGLSPRGVMVASVVGNTLEFYDFLVYGTIAALVFPVLFFPQGGDPAIGVLLSLSTFAVGFFARPVGAAVFGHLGDRIGRRRALMATLIIMGVATILIGCLPVFGQVGIVAPILLVLLRLVQGFAVGGEWGGAVLMISESGHPRNAGRGTSFVQLGSPFGLLLANGAVLLTVTATTDEQFLDWGWRLPFVASALLLVVGIYIRLRLEETPVFKQLEEAGAVAKVPVADVFRHQWRALLLGMGATAVVFSGYYVFTIISVTYLGRIGADTSIVLTGLVVGSALSIPVILCTGRLSDRIGRRPLYWVGAAATAVWGFVFFPLLDTGSAPLIVLAVSVGILTWAIMYGVQGAFLPELFPQQLRYTGSSLAFQLTSALGGLVPVVCIALLTAFGTTAAIGAFVALTAVVSAVAALLAPETAPGALEARGAAAER